MVQVLTIWVPHYTTNKNMHNSALLGVVASCKYGRSRKDKLCLHTKKYLRHSQNRAKATLKDFQHHGEQEFTENLPWAQALSALKILFT